MRTRELEVHLVNVLEGAWHAPFRTESDFARLQANYVAVAADRKVAHHAGHYERVRGHLVHHA
jgi:hypothetical protein